MVEFPTSFSQQTGQKVCSAEESCGLTCSALPWFAVTGFWVGGMLPTACLCLLIALCAPLVLQKASIHFCLLNR